MSRINLIVPETTTNLITNPSVEVATTGWTAIGVGTNLSRITTHQKFGVASLQVINAAAILTGAYFSVNPGSANATFVASAWILHTDLSPSTATLRLRDQTNGTESTQIFTYSPAWQLVTIAHTTGAVPCVDLRLIVDIQMVAGAGCFILDGAQIEQRASVTTYCDGDQLGCNWSSTPHGSTSTRSAQARAGGLIIDLDTYSITVDSLAGLGMPPHLHLPRPHAIMPGGYLQGVHIEPRAITLACHTATTTETGMYSALRQLTDALKIDRVAMLQPVILQYDGNVTTVETLCYYDGGLEGSLVETTFGTFMLRLISYDPFWYEVGNSAVILDSNDTTTLRYMGARLRSLPGGQPWSALGLTNNPATGGTVYAIAENPTNGDVYFGGTWTNLNGVAGRDNIARYRPSDGTWATVGGAAACNGSVRALAFSSTGILFAGGLFTNLGDDNGDFLAQYNPATDTWSNVGGGPFGAITVTSVNALTFGYDGKLYFGGDFTDWAGIAAADYFCSWTSAGGFAAVGAGGTGIVYAVAAAANNDVYIGGNFLNWAAIGAADYVAMWDASAIAWTALSTGMNGVVYALKLRDDGLLYVGGNYGTAGGTTCNCIAAWNGRAFSPLATGLSNTCYCLSIAPDRTLYAGGAFVGVGTNYRISQIARWNGYSWSQIDADLVGGSIAYALLTTNPSPVVVENYDLYLGFDQTGAGYFSGDVVTTNDGTAAGYPVVKVKRSGGTGAWLEMLRNETTGKELVFDLALLDGETITIDLSPGAKTITSDRRGNVLGYLLPGSDLAEWCILPAPVSTTITCYVSVTGAPTVTAYAYWRDAYWSVEGAD